MTMVSVVMPIYNGEKYLSQAIESILAQTYTDFELIIVSEFGTNQASQAIIEQYAKADNRIVVIENESRLGIAASLNRGLRAAKGEYIARMDGDDISLPQRLEKQVEFMDANQDVAISCTRVSYIGENGKKLYYKDNLSEDPDQIKADLLFFCFIHHPSVMFRKSAIFEHDLLYDESYTAAEDHELWCRASRLVRIAAIPEVLLKYRWSRKSSYHTGGSVLDNHSRMILRRSLEDLHIPINEEELSYLQRTTCRESILSYKSVEKSLNSYYNTISASNREFMIYDAKCLEDTLNKRMYWKQHRIRRLAAVILKSAAKAASNDALFYAAIYLELNGFAAVLKRIVF